MRKVVLLCVILTMSAAFSVAQETRPENLYLDVKLSGYLMEKKNTLLK